jgi:hypothetical protein
MTTPTDLHGLLRHYRPTRYDADDRAWMRPAVEARIKELGQQDAITKETLLEDVAWREAKNAESSHVRFAHNFLREVGRTGQWPLWLDQALLASSPIRIGMNPKGRKVRLEVAQESDLVAWQIENSAEQDRHDAEQAARRAGARHIIEWMHDQGVQLFGMIDKGAVPGSSDPTAADDSEEPEE